MRADYYQLLEVSAEATPRELKAAYYRLAMRYHPDHNAGDPAAEERFKLVAEAYRTLGVPERRRDYDSWLRLHNLYGEKPEMEAFAGGQRVRPFHFSARRARERQERRGGRGSERPRARRLYRSLPFVRAGRFNTWLFIGFYALVVFNLLPIFFRHMFAAPARVVKEGAAAAGAEGAPVPEAEARRRVLVMEQALRERAEAGEAEAQYQLGLYLFNKSCRGRGEGAAPTVLRRAASVAWRREALQWLARAAEQGHGAAGRLLRRLQGAGGRAPSS